RPMVCPTTLAHLVYFLLYCRPISCMVYSTRRCTGLSPSRTSGSARPTITDMEYSRYDRRISSSMLTGCTLPAPGPPPSPPGGGVNGNCGFCSSAMFFSHSERRFLGHTASNSSRPRGRAEMFAKCLHLQEVMSQKITGDYITRGLFRGARGD